MRTLTALHALFMLAVRTRFRLGGSYWSWRRETAFGNDPSRRPPLPERIRMILAYGRWVHEMKRDTRPER